ncbi:MAG: RHS repeat domain-containing protein, partial [Nitrospiraceae bacterium]
MPQIAWTLGYDSADNLTTVTPGGGPAYGYAYDPLSRLTLAEIIPYPYWYAAAFTYDANGNRLQHERQNDEP